MLVPDSTVITPKFEGTFFGGAETLHFDGFLIKKKAGLEPAADKPLAGETELQKLALKAIPYFMWANRGRDNMLVWLPYDLKNVAAVAQPTLATRSKATASEGVNGDLTNIADQFPIKNSYDDESSLVHWWPHFGTTEWLQYDFPQAEQVGTARVYFFDDEITKGGCRVPKSWRILYLENGQWKPVYTPNGFKILKDAWNEVQFEPVKTTALRLEMTFQDGVSGGVHEWDVK